jgi:sodium transport system permease protein
VDDAAAFRTLTEVMPVPFKYQLVTSPEEAQDGTMLIAARGDNYSLTWKQRSDKKSNVLLNELVATWVTQANERLRLQSLQALGVDPGVLHPVTFQVIDVTPKEQQQNPLTGMLGYFMALGIIVGGMGIAMDTTAGEKERKTLLTLYASPHTSNEIMLAKWLNIAFFAVGAAILNLLSMTVSLVWLLPMIDEQLDVGFTLSFAVVAQLFSLLLPLAVLLSGLMLAIGIGARTIKEATSWMTPLLVVVVFIGLSSSSLDAAPNSWLYWTPVINVFVCIMDALLHQLTIVHWLVTMATMVAAVGLLGVYTNQLFRKESILFRN